MGRFGAGWAVVVVGALFVSAATLLGVSISGENPPGGGSVTMGRSSPTVRAGWATAFEPLGESAAALPPMVAARATGSEPRIATVRQAASPSPTAPASPGAAVSMAAPAAVADPATHESARSETPAAPAPAPAASAPPAPAPTAPAPAPTAPAPAPTPAPTESEEPAGQWRPLRTNPDGSPVRYDPCRPIAYVTRLTGGPSFARAELDWAIGQIESASGLDLQWTGDTAEPASSSPTSGFLHLGFATEAEFGLPPGVSGYGDSWTTDTGDGRRRYTGGRMVLRPDHGWTQGTSSANPLGLMFLHELGHVVGLGHVSSPYEVMTDRGNGTARSLGAGDRAGLAAVGRQAGCLTYSE